MTVPGSAPRRVVFAQGMRRSGTTVLFDLMQQDARFESFYEPLAAARPAFGGGSGLREEVDVFESVRRERARFFEQRPDILERYPNFASRNELNYGAPRLAGLEFEAQLPEIHRDYLRHLCSAGPNTFLKFTRMHSKVYCLKEIRPDAKFIHIVRDPRHVVASYLFGKGGVARAGFEKKGDYFTRTSARLRWSASEFSNLILQLDARLDPAECTDLLRVLLVWKYKFETTRRQGLHAFGRDYFLFRHEDLVRSPNATVQQLYAFLGMEVPAGIHDWLETNLRRAEPPFLAQDPRWIECFDSLGMHETLESAGYAAVWAG